MENIAAIITPVEMLLVNLFIIDKCSVKKYSVKFTYGILLLSVILLVPISYVLSSINPDLGNGNGFFVFASFIFVIPIKYLYHDSIYKIISKACLSWVYTFFTFSLSIHVSEMLPSLNQVYTVLFIQTAIYALTLGKYYGMVQRKFLQILAQLSEAENHSLMWVSILWFWTIFIMNLSYIYNHIIIIKVFAIASAGGCAYSFYHNIYQMLDSNRAIERLKDVAYKDSLTQLRGRALLNNDVEELISRGIPFKLIFMDLDNFKTINDTYGHLVGDEYLAFFANEVKRRVGEHGGFYRIAGDEFVCVYTSPDIVRLLDSLSNLPEFIPGRDVPFLGVSCGIASYPDDGISLVELMDIADGRMYVNKMEGRG